MTEERPAFWFAPIWPDASAAADDSNDWDFGLVNFGLADITDVPARFPGAVALKARDLGQARIAADHLWNVVGSQECDGRLPDGYQILDTEGFVQVVRYLRGELASS